MVAESFDQETKLRKSPLSKRQKERKKQVERSGKEYRVDRFDGLCDNWY